MKVRIVNRTHWRTTDLRRFIREGIRRERRELCKRGAPELRVRVSYNCGGERYTACSGRAGIGCNWMRLMLPSGNVDKTDLAFVTIHELAHTAGIKHAAMEGCSLYRRVGNWRELASWGESLPLEKTLPVKQTRPTIDIKVEHARKMLARATTREKRAATLRKKWAMRLRRLERMNQEPLKIAATQVQA